MSCVVQKKSTSRRCSVRGCKSGTYSDRRLKTDKGIRQTTIFTPPVNTPALLQTWSKILDQQLTERDRVCELHFEEKYVIKNDYTYLPDGTIFSLPRLKYRLSQDAIPFNPENKKGEDQINEQQKENQTSDGNPITDQTKDSFLDDHQYFIDTKKSHQYVYYNKEVAACFKIPSIKDTLVKKKEELSETSNRNDHICDNGHDDKSVNNDINHCKNDGTNNSTMDNINDGTNDITIDDISDSTNNTIDNINDVTDENSPDKIVKPKLNIQEIIDYLSVTPLQRTWSWMNYTKRDNGITFTQIDCRSRQIKCFVEVHEDLSITLLTGDDKVNLEIEFELTSVESILRMLQTVMRMKICSGTGIEKESRNEDCTGVIIPTEEYKCARSLDRCVACRKLRIKIMHSRDNVDVNVKFSSIKKEHDQLKRRCRYLEEKLDIKTKRLKAITEMIKSVNKYGKNYQPES